MIIIATYLGLGMVATVVACLLIAALAPSSHLSDQARGALLGTLFGVGVLLALILKG